MPAAARPGPRPRRSSWRRRRWAAVAKAEASASVKLSARRIRARSAPGRRRAARLQRRTASRHPLLASPSLTVPPKRSACDVQVAAHRRSSVQLHERATSSRTSAAASGSAGNSAGVPGIAGLPGSPPPPGFRTACWPSTVRNGILPSGEAFEHRLVLGARVRRHLFGGVARPLQQHDLEPCRGIWTALMPRSVIIGSPGCSGFEVRRAGPGGLGAQAPAVHPG